MRVLKIFVSILSMGILVGIIFIAFRSQITTNTVPRKHESAVSHPEGDSKPQDIPDVDADTKRANENAEEIKRLREKNSDVYAWLEVPGTNIDYPILQSASDDAFYLNHDIDKVENMYGAVFTESLNSKDFKDPNTVIYGHNMRDGSMFGTLRNFEDKDFFNSYDRIFVTTDHEIRTYRIFAAYRFSDDHLLKNYDMFSETGIKEYLGKIPEYVENSGGFIREEIPRKAPIITLSSCASGDNTYRLLVHGNSGKTAQPSRRDGMLFHFKRHDTVQLTSVMLSCAYRVH